MNIEGDRVVLVSCVGQKMDVSAPACDLYTSALFAGMRSYAEKHANRWFILSAMHGVLSPSEVIEPYEQTLNTMGVKDRRQWASAVCKELLTVLHFGESITVLAGERYREGVVPFLVERGFPVEIPMKGLRIGEQLRWLKERNYDER